MPKEKAVDFKMRIRVYAGDRMLGPGRMELLANIEATGSLSAAVRRECRT
jgi:molybdenum-dependent DNA-binding transcriptional regulator ModE